ncbi:MAG TPA: LytTR family DNA-binding domain-containing protein, partial [Candidatus Udaeobacter sp.]|nr:LytTR family DNA-binding domain-containing protein [Candidatus Udaeobacter sp.]
MKPRTEAPPAPAPAPAAASTSGRLRAVVVDDEPPAREELIHLLAGIPTVEVIGEAANGVEAVELIEGKRPDLAFLDIRMPGLDGFQVVRHLSRRQAVPQIVFVTAFDQYAIRAFEVSATDYLLKPVEKKRLTAAIDKVKGRIGNVDAPLNLEMLLGALAARRGEHLSRIPVRRGERLGLVDASALVYAYIADGTVYVVAGGASEATSYRTLEELEADLDPQVFIRVHRSYLANINKVTEIIPWFSG